MSEQRSGSQRGTQLAAGAAGREDAAHCLVQGEPPQSRGQGLSWDPGKSSVFPALHNLRAMGTWVCLGCEKSPGGAKGHPHPAETLRKGASCSLQWE